MKLKLLMLCCMLISISCYSYDEEDNIEARIIGGTPAHNGQAPYQCSVEVKGKIIRHYCGCAILSSEWVLTAAHCVKPDVFRIMVGSTNLDSGGTTYDVVKYIVHDKFENPVQAGHDIALIRIQGPIQFNSYVQPIKYSTVEVPPGTEVLATGWGFNSASETVGPRHLQAIKLRVVSKAECEKAWGQHHEGILCTFNRAGEGMCNGDSGGPLVWDNILVGIVSFGKCATGIPDGFTKVSYFANWIKSNTN